MKNRERFKAAKAALFLLCAAALSLTATQGFAATAKPLNSQKKEPPSFAPDALPQMPNLPPEAFAPKIDCSKEEGKTLDKLDEKFLELSAPDNVGLDRAGQETMKMLLDPEQLDKLIKLYVKCGRGPAMHEFDPKTYEQDMKDIERFNRSAR